MTMAVVRDALDSIMHRRCSAQADSDLFSTITSYGLTSAEIAAGVTPINYSYFAQPWMWARRQGCRLDGNTDDSAAFNRCLSVAGSTNMALLIDGPCYLNSNIVIPGNVPIVHVGNGMIKPGAAKYVILGQTPQVGLQQIFDLSFGGTVLLPATSRANEVRGEWWGCNGDGVTNLANEVAINNAMAAIYSGGVNLPAWSSTTAYVVGNLVRNSGVNYVCILGNTNQSPPNATYWAVYTGAGGYVLLGAGAFLISNPIQMLNYCSVKGLNNWTLIKAAGGYSSATMINATNGTSSMFDSRIENLRIDANAISGIGNVILSSSWQNRCGVYNCTLTNFQGTGLGYNHGYGGAAELELVNTDFFPNDVNGATGASFTNDATVGWMKLSIRNCTFASGGANSTTGLSVDNRIICNIQSIDIETIANGILLTTAATLTGSGLSAGGGAGISALIHAAGSWAAPGFIDVSGVQIGAAAACITDVNRAYAIAAVEPMDGRLVWPPNVSRAVAGCTVTGGATPVVAYGNGVSAVSHQAAGQQRLTLTTSMDGTSKYNVIVTSGDIGAPQTAYNKIDATHVDIYTKSATGVATDAGEFCVQIFHAN